MGKGVRGCSRGSGGRLRGGKDRRWGYGRRVGG